MNLSFVEAPLPEEFVPPEGYVAVGSILDAPGITGGYAGMEMMDRFVGAGGCPFQPVFRNSEGDTLIVKQPQWIWDAAEDPSLQA